MTRDGQTCVLHPDTGRLVRARELTRAEWRRLVQQEAAAWQDDDELDERIEDDGEISAPPEHLHSV